MQFKVGGSFEIMEEGVYPATIIKHQEVMIQSQFSGNEEERLEVTFEFEEEKTDGSPQTRNRLFSGTFNEKSKLYELCKATNTPIPTTEEEAAKWSPDLLLNRQCMISIKHTQKGDKTYDNLVGFNRMPKAAKPARKLQQEDVEDPFGE